MRDRSQGASGLTGKRWSFAHRFANSTFIFDLLSEFLFYLRHFIVVIIDYNMEHPFWAGFDTGVMRALKTMVSIDGYEILTAAIQITIISFHK
jgi:hypothetical protein